MTGNAKQNLARDERQKRRALAKEELPAATASTVASPKTAKSTTIGKGRKKKNKSGAETKKAPAQKNTPTRSSRLALSNAKSDQPKDKKPYHWSLRNFFYAKLNENFKNDLGWLLPKEDLKDTKQNSFKVFKKVLGKDTEHGCQFNFKDETITFDLLSNNNESIKALSLVCGAYMHAYQQWQKLDKEFSSDSYQPKLELTVYDENEIKSILEVLKAQNLNVDKIVIVNPENENDQKVIAEPADIEEYTKDNSQRVSNKKNG